MEQSALLLRVAQVSLVTTLFVGKGIFWDEKPG